MVVVGGAVGVDAVPQRERHAEVALTADEPVAVEAFHPVAVAHRHVGRMPHQLLAPGQQRLTQTGAVAVGAVTTAVAQVPLAAGHDLQWPVALFEELHRVGDGPWLAVEDVGVCEHFHDAALGLGHTTAGQLAVGVAPGGVGDPLGGVGQQPAVGADDRPGGKVELAPPDHVGGVTERADHGDARSLVGVGQAVGVHRHVHAKQGRAHRGAKQRLVALVVGMGHQCHTRRDQLGTGGLDGDGVTCGGAVGGHAGKRDAVVRPGTLAIFEFGLGHGGAKVHVPQHRGVGLVGLAAFQVVQERLLGHGLGVGVDGGVRHRPINRQSQGAPQGLERLFVGDGEFLAQLHEVAPAQVHRGLFAFGLGAIGHGDRGGEVGVVGQRRVALHPVVVLHPALGGQAVVVPAHGVEHLGASHAAVAGDGVGVGVGKNVTHVQRSRRRGRGGVDGVHPVPGCGAVKAVGVVGVPRAVPAILQPLECRLVGHVPRCPG